MAKHSTSVCKKKKSILKLKIAVEKLQRSLSLGRSSSSRSSHDFDESTCVPEDVKEGHFAVVAVEGGDPKRFVVPLSYLTHPTFLRLLEQSAEEFGFDHDGALAIPCRPSELEEILDEEISDRSSDGGGSHVNWGSCESMVQSY